MPEKLAERGSPPRLWGKPGGHSAGAVRTRFTPTLVGKTRRPFSRRGENPVHPHACGENKAPRVASLKWRGSPPRLWGKLWLLPAPIASLWFTPTLVGKTCHSDARHNTIEVHPHACGENARRRRRSLLALGSPPRLWGKLAHLLASGRGLRFTPTLVGKTDFPDMPLCVSGVHPHACGENSRTEGRLDSQGGSPPRLWGKPILVLQGVHHKRFTPTLVGKTNFLERSLPMFEVHPHACGENSVSLFG